jgi:hypothetical protein
MNPDFKDFFIKSESSKRYTVNKMIESDIINVIVQKLELLLFTRTGEVYGKTSFGLDLEYYLWQTDISTKDLRDLISTQIHTYIPELETIGFVMNLNIYDGDVRDILILDFIIKGYNVEFIIK